MINDIERVREIPPVLGTNLVNLYDPFSVGKGFATQKDVNAAYATICDTMENYELLMESADFQEVDDYYNPGKVEVERAFILEAVVIQKYSMIETKIEQFWKILKKSLDADLIPTEDVMPTIGKPRKADSYAYVSVQFPFADGQTLSIIFHAPEGDNVTARIAPNDKLTAFRWLLNKRDITKTVTPENEQEVNVKEVLKRVAQLAKKNSEHFQKAQKATQEEKQKLETLQEDVKKAETQQEILMSKAGIIADDVSTLDAQIANTQTLLEKQKAINAELQTQLDGLKASYTEKQTAISATPKIIAPSVGNTLNTESPNGIRDSEKLDSTVKYNFKNSVISGDINYNISKKGVDGTPLNGFGVVRTVISNKGADLQGKVALYDDGNWYHFPPDAKWNETLPQGAKQQTFASREDAISAIRNNAAKCNATDESISTAISGFGNATNVSQSATRGYTTPVLKDTLQNTLAKINDPILRNKIDAEINALLAQIPNQNTRTSAREVLRTPNASEIDPAQFTSPADVQIFIPSRSMPENAKYTLIEAVDIQASHLPENGFRPNPEYTLENERRYHEEEGSQTKVINNAMALRPAFVLNESVDANNGAPVIDQENMVLGGNGRIMSLKLAYKNGGRIIENYKMALKDRLGELGIDPRLVDGMEQPILVRRITTKYTKQERQALVSALNDTFTDSKNVRMSGKTRGDRLSTKSLNMLAVGLASENGEVQTLREYFDNPSSFKVVESLIADGVINQQERNALLTSDGLLNPDGKTAVETALRGRITNSYESLAKMPADIVTKLDAIAPSIVIAENAGGNWDITTAIKESVDLLAEYYRSESSRDGDFNGFLKRSTFETKAPEARYSRIAQQFFLILLNTKKKEVADKFYRFAHDALKATDKQAGGFGLTLPTAEKSAKKYFGITLPSNTANTAPLVTESSIVALQQEQPPSPLIGENKITIDPNYTQTATPAYISDLQQVSNGKMAGVKNATAILRNALIQAVKDGVREKFTQELNTAKNRIFQQIWANYSALNIHNEFRNPELSSQCADDADKLFSNWALPKKNVDFEFLDLVDKIQNAITEMEK